jgi:hypothetical protein
MLRAALGAFFTAFSAFLAAALGCFLARAFSATLCAFGTTRFRLLLIGLGRALRTLGHRHCESGQQEGEQHDDYSALSGFHCSSPIDDYCSGDRRTHRDFRCETLAR